MPGLRHFELLEELRPGLSGKAVLLQWNGHEYIPSRQIVELLEFSGSHGNKGDRGFCFLSEESGRWEVASGLFEQVAAWLP